MLHDRADIELHSGVHVFRRRRLSACVIYIKEPCWGLLVPHKRVGAHLQTVVLRHLQGLIQLLKSELRNNRIRVIVRHHIPLCQRLVFCNTSNLSSEEGIWLHLVFQRKTVKLLLHKIKCVCILQLLVRFVIQTRTQIIKLGSIAL